MGAAGIGSRGAGGAVTGKGLAKGWAYLLPRSSDVSMLAGLERFVDPGVVSTAEGSIDFSSPDTAECGRLGKDEVVPVADMSKQLLLGFLGPR